MNPFAWRGPEFLVFYFTLAIALLAWQFYNRRRREGHRTGLSAVRLADPYEVAYLRGGKNAALQVATVSMVERHLLRAEDDGRLATRGHQTVPTDPIELFVFNYFKSRESAYKLMSAPATPTLTAALAQIQTRLESAGLLRGDGFKNSGLVDSLQVSSVLAIVGAIKLWIAVEQGRSNIGFLIVLMLLSISISLVYAARGRVTALGQETIGNLQSLCSGMHSRSHLGAAEIALAAAVLGMAALPAMGAPYAEKLYPRAAAAGSSGSCGSSSGCGSSSSGGGDSGGGGDGGGGGGCGGCGGGGGD